MPIKQQDKCYRVINGLRYENYSDLIMGDTENEQVIREAKSLYAKVRKIKHPSGYYQLFVTNEKKFKAQFVNVGRNNVCRDVYFDTTRELHKEIQKHILSKGWGMEETETEGTWQITCGFRVTGTIIITEVKINKVDSLLDNLLKQDK